MRKRQIREMRCEKQYALARGGFVNAAWLEDATTCPCKSTSWFTGAYLIVQYVITKNIPFSVCCLALSLDRVQLSKGDKK
jgi:hypothetical protein